MSASGICHEIVHETTRPHTPQPVGNEIWVWLDPIREAHVRVQEEVREDARL